MTPADVERLAVAGAKISETADEPDARERRGRARLRTTWMRNRLARAAAVLDAVVPEPCAMSGRLAPFVERWWGERGGPGTG
jgi:hypothetical protein